MATWSTRPSPSRRACRRPAAQENQRTTRRLGNTRGERPAVLRRRGRWRPRRDACNWRPSRRSRPSKAASALPFAEGCRRERELFFECVQGEQAQCADPRLLRRTGGRQGSGSERHPGDRRSRRRDWGRDDGGRHCDGVRERRPRGRARRHRPGGDRQGHVGDSQELRDVGLARSSDAAGGRRAPGARSTLRLVMPPCATPISWSRRSTRIST